MTEPEARKRARACIEAAKEITTRDVETFVSRGMAVSQGAIDAHYEGVLERMIAKLLCGPKS